MNIYISIKNSGDRFMNRLRLMTLSALLLLICSHAFAQSPKLLWSSAYSGQLDGMDAVSSVIADSFGNIYVTGICYHSFGGGDFATVMYDGSGNRIWADHFINNEFPYSNYGVRLVLDKWQNAFAVGTTALHEGDLAVCKYNSSGRIWARNYEPYWFSTYDDYGIDMDVDSSGNFYAIARVTSPSGNLYDLYVMKCDSSGSRIWEENYTGASENDYPAAIDVTPGGTAYVLLKSFNFWGTQTHDILTMQYLPNGVQNWFSNYNGAGNGSDYPTSISMDQQENQYVCGTANTGFNNDMVAIKQNSFGTRLWTVTYNGSANEDDTAIGITSLPNGNTVATGKGRVQLGGNTVEAIITLIIDNGNILRTISNTGSGNYGASPADMITDADGNIYICGYEYSSAIVKNAFVLKYDLNGEMLWSTSFDGAAHLDDQFNSIALDMNGNIIAAGQSFTSGSNSEYIVAKYGNNSTHVSHLSETANGFSLGQNYPNPFNPVTSIQFEIAMAGMVTLKVYDMSGRLVSTPVNSVLNTGRHSLQFEATGLQSGVYFYSVYFGSRLIDTKRMVLLK